MEDTSKDEHFHGNGKVFGSGKADDSKADVN